MTQLTIRNKPACECQYQWFPVFEQELRELGLIEKELTLAQLIGGAKASAGTHTGGGVADWWETDVEIAKVAREMGAPATWPRTTGSFATNKHTHSVLRGCPHLAPAAVKQIVEVDAGGDGLVGSVADAAVLRKSLNTRTWKQGVTWAKKRQLQRARRVSIGTHNTLDGQGKEIGFADIILFTEAIPKQVRAGLEKTHRVWVCRDQKDLAIAVHRRLKPRVVGQAYKLANLGIPLVTPKRGTWRLTLDLLGVTISIIADHRINAAFPPFIRGEQVIRQRFWKRHTAITKRMIRWAKERGHAIVYGGDPNTPRHITAVGNTLNWEAGEGKDRLASNRPIEDFEQLAKAGSDHHRIRAYIQL
jgi:hypothetical protein